MDPGNGRGETHLRPFPDGALRRRSDCPRPDAGLLSRDNDGGFPAITFPTMKKLLCSLLPLVFLAGLAFSHAGCSATATRQSTGEYIDDTALTAKVKTALITDETVKAFDVQVETFRGAVQLSGFVDSETQRSRAEQVARGVAGVSNVVNNIQLKTDANNAANNR